MNARDWQPTATIETLKQRARLVTEIRTFFTNRHYLEVDTPAMAHYGVSDPYLSNIKAHFRNTPYCLQTSPEYHMKRLLASGSGPIFQLARVFRDDELGRVHNPEFTLLEWYQLGINHHQLMDEVDIFLQQLIKAQPMVRISYQDAFLQYCGICPFSCSIKELQQTVERFDLAYVFSAEEANKDAYLFLLMSHVVEEGLANNPAPVAVYHFPPSQAALAQIHNGVAERFEVYYQGVELANGFHELTDADAQMLRFKNDNQQRQQLGFSVVETDPWLIKALEHGIPACSGVALGVDRLLALALDKSSIAEVMAFAVDRA